MARKYHLGRRALHQEKTRQRIVEAAVALHMAVGPARASVLAIAKRAGVERPTVYRHFPTMKDLFNACSSHYWTKYPPPDPEPWLKINDPEARLRQGLIELYGYYSLHEQTIWQILRDLEDNPKLRPFAARRIAHRKRVVDILTITWASRGSRQTVTSAIGHATDFFAWRSLHRQGLSNEGIVDLMVRLVLTIWVSRGHIEDVNLRGSWRRGRPA